MHGWLDVKKGSFVVMQKAFASAAQQSLVIEIVPGTGSGALAGITGTMHIDIVDKKHFYTVNYALPADLRA